MLTKCIWCGNKQIITQKNLLCKKCTSFFLRTGTLKSNISTLLPERKIQTKMTRKARIVKNLRVKYGIEILGDFLALSYKPFWNLTILSQKHSFSRERARQLLFDLIGRSMRPTLKLKTKRLKENDLACKYDPLYKIAEHKETSTIRQGAIIQQLFLFECAKRNMEVKIQCDRPEFKVNDFDVKVLSRSAPQYSKWSKTILYRYNIRKDEKKDIDFFACWHQTEKAFFIIPKNSRPSESSANICILEKQSNHVLAKNRYWEYKDAWHLLTIKPPQPRTHKG